MGNETIREFTDLNAWQKAHEVVLLTYRATKHFPKDEMFGLTNQMRRASISAESNIAEGFGRNTQKDKQHFFGIAKGSLLELQSQSITARDLEYLTEEEFQKMRATLLHAIQRWARAKHERIVTHSHSCHSFFIPDLRTSRCAQIGDDRL